MAYGGDGSQVPLQDDGKSTDVRRATRLAVLGIVVVIAAVFIAQNNDRVQLDFLVVGVRTRVWVGMLATLLLGRARAGGRGAVAAPPAQRRLTGPRGRPRPTRPRRADRRPRNGSPGAGPLT